MLNGHLLHELGYHGEGMAIGVLDAGFKNVDENQAFSKLRSEDRLLGVKDFVEANSNVFDEHSHGALVLSTMAAYYPDSIIGTAFMADYYLVRSEEAALENVVEEDNWVAAIEFCDSLGLDVINTSLGYSMFDDSTMNHVIDDLDGNTTRITIASDIAASKGMLLVTSAGNSGSSEWHFITAPADADSILTIGAVDAAGHHASFSSFGPTADGRVKPDVVAMGKASAYVATNGLMSTGNGTSFSSPIIAGLTACLWQAFPDKSNMEIIDAIRRSAHTYSSPSDSLGYGIPDFWKAFNMLRVQENSESALGLEIFPNPFSNHVSVSFEANDTGSIKFELYDVSGRRLSIVTDGFSSGATRIKTFDFEWQDLPRGVYVFKLVADGVEETRKIIKY
jgi:subtilisin family serine protease